MRYLTKFLLVSLKYYKGYLDCDAVSYDLKSHVPQHVMCAVKTL